MNLTLDYTGKQLINARIKVSGSKSESNRLLILQQFYKNLSIENLSNSDDTQVMQKILSSTSGVADVHHAGTAMRFLTAYFSATAGKEMKMTGSERMQQRPIKILVDALTDLGTEIDYVNETGFPPLRIKRGTKLIKNEVAIQGNVSSQYISALLLIAPSLKNGLTINLIGEITSRPYLEMTLSLLNQVGIQHEWIGNSIKIHPKNKIEDTTIVVESDWSSASYFYSLIALSEVGAQVELSSYKKDSLQGDSCLAEIYQQFGVETMFHKNTITLKKTHVISNESEKSIKLDLKSAPDIAQTIAVTCFGLGLACNLTGLHTLKIKETDRLVALQNELEKFGASIEISNDSLHLGAHSLSFGEGWGEAIAIETYNDHRMAMAFAPLALKTPIIINDAEVVTKSYVDFWKDLEGLF